MARSGQEPWPRGRPMEGPRQSPPARVPVRPPRAAKPHPQAGPWRARPASRPQRAPWRGRPMQGLAPAQ
eukprot:8072784-Alexandrium_andersonii.AAC.1